METIPLIGITVWAAAKVFILLALAIYIIFALVVIKQIGLMLSTLEMGLGIVIRLIGWAHLFFAIGILILAIIIL